MRERGGDRRAGQEHAAAPHPRVLFLSQEALHADHLTGWLDQGIAMDAPLIVCVGSAEQTAPQARHALAQRRIDLFDRESAAQRHKVRSDILVAVTNCLARR